MRRLATGSQARANMPGTRRDAGRQVEAQLERVGRGVDGREQIRSAPVSHAGPAPRRAPRPAAPAAAERAAALCGTAAVTRSAAGSYSVNSGTAGHRHVAEHHRHVGDDAVVGRLARVEARLRARRARRRELRRSLRLRGLELRLGPVERSLADVALLEQLRWRSSSRVAASCAARAAWTCAAPAPACCSAARASSRSQHLAGLDAVAGLDVERDDRAGHLRRHDGLAHRLDDAVESLDALSPDDCTGAVASAVPVAHARGRRQSGEAPPRPGTSAHAFTPASPSGGPLPWTMAVA